MVFYEIPNSDLEASAFTIKKMATVMINKANPKNTKILLCFATPSTAFLDLAFPTVIRITAIAIMAMCSIFQYRLEGTELSILYQSFMK